LFGRITAVAATSFVIGPHLELILKTVAGLIIPITFYLLGYVLALVLLQAQNRLKVKIF